MTNIRNRLLSWGPGASGFNHDEVILAVGFQCRDKKFAVSEAMSWMGTPDITVGDSCAGHLFYFFRDDHARAAMFDFEDGELTSFGTVAKDIALAMERK